MKIISEQKSSRGIPCYRCFRYTQLVVTKDGPICDACRAILADQRREAQLHKDSKP